MKKISYIIFLGAIFSVTLSMIEMSCKGGGEKKTETASADSTKNEKVKTVEITKLAPQTFNNYVEVQGKVDADENVSINAEIAGTVSKINVKLGNEVAIGQVLAE